MSRYSAAPKPLESAVLVYINPNEEEDLVMEEEFAGLCEAALVEPVASLRQRLSRPNSRTFVGSGKAIEIAELVSESDADVVLIDGEISAVQQRNLQEVTGRKVVDRTQLILDIFARRATTREGMLQVELAQLSYIKPKLMTFYTKFERQKGGIGMRGPGETKLESDRRMVDDKISKLKVELEDVKRIRGQQRLARRRHPFPFASIVGYTSAGKSTLMNRLSGTELLVDAMPFATLDPTTRKVELPNGYSLFLTDTVGFIRNLPTHLVAAFRATLEEVTQSDFLIHLVDISNSAWESQMSAVDETLQVLNAAQKPMITVFNKMDLVEDPTTLRRLVAEHPMSVTISASSGRGVDELMRFIMKQVQDLLGSVKALVPYSESALVQDCYDFGKVLKVDYRDEGIYIEAEIVEEMRKKLEKYNIS